jgi:photosynthetic reaction center cytochrome c subunit
MLQKFLAKIPIPLVLLACSAGAALGQTETTKASAPKAKVAEEAYQNIQVLKGVPADQLIPAMQFITYSLGVECSYCHVEGALEKDDKKPKQTARKMMQMMTAINRDNFDAKRMVTCYSCHRGASRPVATPVIADAGTQPTISNMPEQQAELPSNVPPADLILSKYVAAVGGAVAIGKLTTRVDKGTMTFGGRQLPVEVFSKIGDKRVTIIHLPNGDNVTAYNGSSGWTSSPNRPVRDIPANEVASARVEADLQLPLHLKELFSELKTTAPEKIGEHEVYVISALNSGDVAAKFYFDEESGFLLRTLRYTDSPLGRTPTEIDYADYRVQDGLKLPFQETIARPNSRFVIQIAETKYNVAVEDGKFARPAAESSPAKPPLP